MLSLKEAIKKMISLTTDTYGLKTKGEIRPGMDADLIIFNPDRIINRATFENPAKITEGIYKVIIGGKVAVYEGHVTGHRQGRLLRNGLN